MGQVSLSLFASGPAILWRIEPVVKTADREFEAFFLAHYDAVVNTVTVITGDRDRSVDAAQEAFIKAYAKWSKVRTYDVPAAWVRRIAINASRDRYRSERRRARRESPYAPRDDRSHVDDIVGHDFAIRILTDLPRRQREVATLFYVDDLGIQQIAAILGLRSGTVKSHLADARIRMRALLEREATG